MLRQTDKRQLAGRVSGECRAVVFQTPARHTWRQIAESFEHGAITEQQADAAVFDHVMQTVERVFRV
ncbi:hypothetical protein D3C87_1038940 [compost metagenome]